MEFRNLTPFSVMCYQMLDKSDNASHVVTMKVGFRLVKVADGQYRPEIMDQDPLPLCISDEYRGELNSSSVLQESDLAPFKPACDVIINATGYAPGGKPCTVFPVGVKLSTADGSLLLDKHLLINGERQLNRQLSGQWQLTDPVPFTSLSLDYCYSFGGECVIHSEDEKSASRIPSEYRLTNAQLADHPEPDHPPVAHTVCASNPLGLGYTEPWYIDATKVKTLAVPRILSITKPMKSFHFHQIVDGSVDFNAPEYQPAGFGIIGRSWLPRLAKAGTYDQHWLDHRHPYLPHDFDFSYWNGAPVDQQIPFPTSDLTLELTNLTPEGQTVILLPHHLALILLRLNNGSILPQPMLMDTLLIDLENMIIAQTWRYVATTALPVRVMEARYEVRPEMIAEKLLPHREKAHG
ncbi:DUF2169 family type VI secretion system accessory protein [Hafnia paralvei]|uniref:DUF2169 family type VI secretion system accessory protein n=1 Tax=Hafnia paralvei TaxID=546367 RepID=UPI003C2D67A7